MANPNDKRRLLASYLEGVAPRLREEGMGSGLESLPAGQAAMAQSGLEKLITGQGELTPEEAWTLEAIVLPKERPVWDVVSDTYAVEDTVWRHFGQDETRANLQRAILGVGRVEVPGHPTKPYSGTGFVVGKTLLMTNRHVAADFSSGVGQEIKFLPGQGSALDFVQERVPRAGVVVEVKRVVMVHPFWDMALLEVDGLPPERSPLGLSVDALPEGRDVAVIGYPAYSPFNDARLQAEIFRNVFNVKRLQPGKLRGVQPIQSFGKQVGAVGHDASTLGGNSGSAVIDPRTGSVIALHFAGEYLKMNYAVPTWELARDSRIVDAGVDFVGKAPGGDPWADWWGKVETTSSRPRPAPATDGFRRGSQPAPADGIIEITIPLHISVRLGEPAPTPVAAAVESVPVPEAPSKLHVEPDPNYEGRKGYDASFLGADTPIALPLLPLDHRDDVTPNGWDTNSITRHLIPYHHFSVCLRRSRRLAWFVAVNIDGRREVAMPRNLFDRDTWHYDPRLPRKDQIGDEFYGTPYDRGHLVRRLDPVWGGDFDEAKKANDDTFHWTNCSPQHKDFNREDALWAGIEDHVLKNALLRDLRVTVFTGPVLRASDPSIHGVRVPLEFWKVVAMRRSNGRLATAAYLLSQADLVATTEESFLFGAWRTFQVPVTAIEARTGLSFGRSAASDVLSRREESTAADAVPLTTLADMHL